VRAALRAIGAAAADESPRLLRNTYGRRHLAGRQDQRTGEQPVRQTLTETGEPDDADVVRKAARNFMSISVIK
jgi:hypothetical protein